VPRCQGAEVPTIAMIAIVPSQVLILNTKSLLTSNEPKENVSPPETPLILSDPSLLLAIGVDDEGTTVHLKEFFASNTIV
jgi:hypothetical protein